MKRSGDITAHHALGLPAGSPEKNLCISWQDGIITKIEPCADLHAGARNLVIPALANAHDHARPLSMSSFGAAFLPLEAWLPRTVLATPPDPYLAAAAALGRSARAGCGSVMVHYTRPSGKLSPVDEAKAVERARADIGIRMAFAPALRDINPLVYGDEQYIFRRLSADAAKVLGELFLKSPASPQQLIETTEAVAAAIEGPMTDVQFGPAGVQWCSDALLRAISIRSKETGRRVHMHFLETTYQRRWADHHFPNGIVSYLKDIGLLSPRLTLAHCVYARPHELDMIAEAGCRIVTNSSSNLHLRSGVGLIGEAWRKGCKLAVGIDGQALDEDDDILRELRLVNLLHGGVGFQATWSRDDLLKSTIAHGREANGASGTGQIAVGEPADLLVLDYDKIDRDQILDLKPIDLFFARASGTHVKELYVDGRRVVGEGNIIGIAIDEIEQRLRKEFRLSLSEFDRFLANWPEIEDALSDWGTQFQGCC